MAANLSSSSSSSIAQPTNNSFTHGAHSPFAPPSTKRTSPFIKNVTHSTLVPPKEWLARIPNIIRIFSEEHENLSKQKSSLMDQFSKLGAEKPKVRALFESQFQELNGKAHNLTSTIELQNKGISLLESQIKKHERDHLEANRLCRDSNSKLLVLQFYSYMATDSLIQLTNQQNAHKVLQEKLNQINEKIKALHLKFSKDIKEIDIKLNEINHEISKIDAQIEIIDFNQVLFKPIVEIPPSARNIKFNFDIQYSTTRREEGKTEEKALESSSRSPLVTSRTTPTTPAIPSTSGSSRRERRAITGSPLPSSSTKKKSKKKNPIPNASTSLTSEPSHRPTVSQRLLNLADIALSSLNSPSTDTASSNSSRKRKDNPEAEQSSSIFKRGNIDLTQENASSSSTSTQATLN